MGRWPGPAAFSRGTGTRTKSLIPRGPCSAWPVRPGGAAVNDSFTCSVPPRRRDGAGPAVQPYQTTCSLQWCPATIRAMNPLLCLGSICLFAFPITAQNLAGDEALSKVLINSEDWQLVAEGFG